MFAAEKAVSDKKAMKGVTQKAQSEGTRVEYFTCAATYHGGYS